MDSQDSQNRLPRRRVLQLFAAVAAAEGVALPAALAQAAKPAATGYGQDPKMAKTYEKGEAWPLTFTEAEKKAVVSLADMIFPKDDLGPAASEVRVADFIDEWVSAPYPRQQGDRKVIIPGLKKLDEACQSQFKATFADLSEDQKKEYCDQIVNASFFHVFTSICTGAYYSDPRCWKAIGYAGNQPYAGPFLGPPKEILEKLGLEQTVIGE